jgi:hypothetical protein
LLLINAISRKSRLSLSRRKGLEQCVGYRQHEIARPQFQCLKAVADDRQERVEAV